MWIGFAKCNGVGVSVGVGVIVTNVFVIEDDVGGA